MENINRGVEDAFYRYKMPKLQSKIEGNGNGIKTVVPNMKEIAKSLDRPPEYPTKFFGFELGAQTIMDEKSSRYIINGAHEAKKLAELLDVFIKKFVLCPACGNPETEMIFKASKVGRDKDLFLSCKACGRTSPGDSAHKLCTYIAKSVVPDKKGEKKAEKKAEKKTAKKDSDEETPIVEDSGSVDGLAEVTDKVKINDPTELFAAVVAQGDKNGSELALEASKLDLSEDLAAAVLVQVLLDQNIGTQFKKHQSLLKDFAQTEKAKKGILGGVERLIAVTYPELLPKAPQIIKLFYDADIVDEDLIINWAEKPTKKFSGDKELAKKARDAAAPLIEWLKNAEEESEEEDDE